MLQEATRQVESVQAGGDGCKHCEFPACSFSINLPMCSYFAIMRKFITKEDIMRKLLVIVFLLCCANTFGMSPKLNWEQAIDHAIVKYGLKQEPALKKMFQTAGVHYPPQEIALKLHPYNN